MEQLEEQIRVYFAACDATRERTPLKNGGFMERQIPYTLYGLGAAIGYAPMRILQLANGRGKRAKLLRAAVSRIAAYTLERALLGDLAHQPALAALELLNATPGTASDAACTVKMDASAAQWAE